MTYYKPGTWNCICDVCGGQFKSDEILKRWDGALVCRADFEVRHSADFLRARTERGTVPFVSLEPPDTFIYVCYIEFSQGISDIGEADCSRADTTFPSMFSY